MNDLSSSASLWQQWRLTQPNAIAIRAGDRTITWNQLALIVDDLNDQLVRHNVQSGQVITLICRYEWEAVALYLANLQIGAITAFVMADHPAAIKHKLTTLYDDLTQAKVWRSNSAGDVVLPNKVTPLALQFRSSVQVNAPITTKADTSESVVTQPNLALITKPACGVQTHDRCDQSGSIIFTSGSTGEPKAVLHSVQHHRASAQGLLSHFVFEADDSWLLSLPLFHVSGLSIVHRWLEAGARLNIAQGSLVADLQGVTHASLVATQLQRLLSGSHCLQEMALKRVLLGGSHVPRSLMQQAAQSGIEVWLGYGMTEMASTVTAARFEPDNSAVHGSGALLPKRELRIENERIWVRGETLALGYYCQGSVTPLADEDGWFDTKDLGRWQGDQLQILGRSDNLFISGGENVHCEEVEQALVAHPDIAQAMVVPFDDAEYGQRPVAAIDAQNVPENLSLHLQQHLSRFKHPIACYLLPDELKPIGIKLSRQKVTKWVQGHHGHEE